MQDFKEASAEIKVKTKRFSLKKGTIKICFELPEEKGQIRSLKLKLRNEIMDVSYPFIRDPEETELSIGRRSI